uniref:Uncharacterized protein n=1 Tax=Branchiostoma floridae TaxID=7739 RepID=C3ZMN9_BRAFL|eukprot:XP_002590238.1 hypothetical protein BRAFLDRAFT_97396 [Branchiostoma floridae]
MVWNCKRTCLHKLSDRKILSILQQDTDTDVKPASQVGDDVKLGDHSAPMWRSKRSVNTITTPYGLVTINLTASAQIPSGVPKDRPDETGGTAVMVFLGRPVLRADVGGVGSRPANRVRLDQSARLDQRVNLDLRARLDHRARLDQRVHLDHRARLDQRVRLEHRARLDQRVHLDQTARLDQKVSLDKGARLDQKVRLDQRGLLDHLEQ